VSLLLLVTELMRIALGSERAAKVAALHSSLARICSLDAAWCGAVVIARAVELAAPAMPLTDMELMCGARERADMVRASLEREGESAELYVGLEGGFHSMQLDGRWHTFLRGWAYATDSERGCFGVSPSISVPDSLARRVIEGGLELSQVIDEVANERDVRSRQGAWGVFSRDLLTRAMSFEAALIAAFAPFYNAQLYA
jgi:non-canonical (house-cleaning) NTP pyrophosphatase